MICEVCKGDGTCPKCHGREYLEELRQRNLFLERELADAKRFLVFDEGRVVTQTDYDHVQRRLGATTLQYDITRQRQRTDVEALLVRERQLKHALEKFLKGQLTAAACWELLGIKVT